MRRNRLPLLALVAVLPGLACHEIHFEPRTEAGEIGIYDDLFSVSVVDGQNVVAAGYWGSIYHSSDGGATWEKAETGTKRLIYNVSMADAQRGWAVGQLGTILRTEDGGRTWTPQPNVKQEQGPHLFGVHAIDANTAWAVGEWGSRLFTDDAGKNWQDHSLTIDEAHPQFVWLAPVEQDRVRRGEKVFEDVGLNDVYCRPPPSQHCWIVGEFGYIFHSETQGRAWERADITGTISIDPITMEHDDLAISEEHKESLRGFAEQIANLQHLNVEIAPRVTQRELGELIEDDGDPIPIFELLEARARNVQSIIEEAGILQDRMRVRGAPPWDWEDFIEDDPGFLDRYLEGRVSEQAGVHVGVDQNPYLFTVRFADDQYGLISGLGGIVLRSEDGGHNWSYQSTDRKQALFSVHPANGFAIAVGEKGFVRVSGDQGKSWKEPEAGFPTIFTFMRDVDFAPDDETGFIVGQAGMVLRTTDGGESWGQVLPPGAKSGYDLRI